jgi:hypothetical protein
VPDLAAAREKANGFARDLMRMEPRVGGYYYTNFGIGTGGDAEGDTLLSIQKLVGSNYDDKLIGDYHDNVLSGGAGNNTLVVATQCVGKLPPFVFVISHV